MICVFGWRLRMNPIVFLSLTILFEAPAITFVFQC